VPQSKDAFDPLLVRQIGKAVRKGKMGEKEKE